MARGAERGSGVVAVQELIAALTTLVLALAGAVAWFARSARAERDQGQPAPADTTIPPFHNPPGPMRPEMGSVDFGVIADQLGAITTKLAELGARVDTVTSTCTQIAADQRGSALALQSDLAAAQHQIDQIVATINLRDQDGISRTICPWTSTEGRAQRGRQDRACRITDRIEGKLDELVDRGRASPATPRARRPLSGEHPATGSIKPSE